MNYHTLTQTAISATGAINMSALMKVAHAAAKAGRYDGFTLPGDTYAERFALALRRVWQDAHRRVDFLRHNAAVAALPLATRQHRAVELRAYVAAHGLSN